MKEKSASQVLPKVNLITAVDTCYGIGKNNDLPWNLPKEYAHFEKMTSMTSPGKKPAVIMGRRTWESIAPFAEEFARNRIVIIVSASLKESMHGTYICRTYDDALALLSGPLSQMVHRIWNCGGSEIYRIGLAHPSFHRLYITRIHGKFDCDILFPDVDWEALKRIQDPHVPEGVQEDNEIHFEVEVYERMQM